MFQFSDRNLISNVLFRKHTHTRAHTHGSLSRLLFLTLDQPLLLSCLILLSDLTPPSPVPYYWLPFYLESQAARAARLHISPCDSHTHTLTDTHPRNIYLKGQLPLQPFHSSLENVSQTCEYNVTLGRLFYVEE